MHFHFSYLIGIMLVKSILADEFSLEDSSSLDYNSEEDHNSTHTYGNSSKKDHRTTRAIRIPSTRKPSATPEEDIYIEHFGNDRYRNPDWKTIQHWYYEVGEPKLKELCAKAHKQAGYGKEVNVDVVILNVATLVFTNTNYTATKIDILIYGVEEPTNLDQKKPYWYITQGIRPDCVFYLNVVKDYGLKELKLKKLVCGVKVF